MSVLNQLQHKATEVLQEIVTLGPMRKGSLCKRLLKRKTTKGQVKTRGPYWYYTFKNNNQTVAKMLKDADTPLFQEQIETFRRFQSLSKQYCELSHQMADIEAQKSGRKKTLGQNRGGKGARGGARRRASARGKGTGPRSR